MGQSSASLEILREHFPFAAGVAPSEKYLPLIQYRQLEHLFLSLKSGHICLLYFLSPSWHFDSLTSLCPGCEQRPYLHPSYLTCIQRWQSIVNPQKLTLIPTNGIIVSLFFLFLMLFSSKNGVTAVLD